MKRVSYLYLAMVFIGTVAPMAAQTVPPFDPPKAYKPTKMNLYTSHCALWRTDGTFESTIRLSNQLVISKMKATVTLLMADGTPYVLPAVVLEKGGVATVNINRALEDVPANVLPHLSTFGSASVSYRYDWQGVVYASMSILDIPRSLQYSYPFVFPMHGSMAMEQKPASTVMEALLWSYSRHSEAFLSFANSSSHDINVALGVVEDGRMAFGDDRFVIPAGNTVLKILAMRGGNDWSRAVGGVRIAFDAEADNLSVVGGIEDDAHGYSANIPLAEASPGGDARTKTSLASTGMMAGKQDPMMGFPENLRFEPYAYFRNIGDSAIRLSSSLYYDHNGKAQSSAVPELLIPPHQSRELAISEVLRGIDAGSVTLAYSYTGTPNALLAATGSVDQTGNYVFEVEPRGVGETASKSAIYWLVGNGFDTMYSLWNPTKTQQDLLLTFRYGVGQTYEHPVHLAPNGTAMVDIKQLAEMGMPDRNGHVLPLSATEGSLILSAGNGSEYHPISVALAGGIYNPKTATCNPTCETCNGCTSIPPSLTPNPFGEPVANSGWLYSQCSWYNGTQYTYNTSASWSSNNTGIATVQTGNSNAGLTYGAGGGSATVSSFGQSIPTNAGQICGSPGPPACPVAAPAQSGPAKIQTPTSLSGPTGSPAPLTNQTLTDCNGNTKSTNWYGYRWCAPYTVLDQNVTQIKTAGLAFDEDLNVTDTNVGLTGTKTSGTTNAQFQLVDFLALGRSGSAIPAGSYAYTVQTITYHPNGKAVRVNCLAQLATTESVTDITSNPSTPCHH